MVGIFDSGMGGAFALTELRKLSPDADVVFRADRKNAPYGTKPRELLINLVERNIDVLRSYGAEDILIACCTASTVYAELQDRYRKCVIPIIDATAYAAVMTSESKRIGVLATESTVRSGAFENAIHRYCARAEVRSCAVQPLVSAIEQRKETDYILAEAVSRLGGVDTVILGCTHFAAVEEKIKKEGLAAVNSARVGAELLSGHITSGCGATLYINE